MMVIAYSHETLQRKWRKTDIIIDGRNVQRQISQQKNTQYYDLGRFRGKYQRRVEKMPPNKFKVNLKQKIPELKEEELIHV